MGIVIGLDSGRREFAGEEIVIGRSPSAQLSLPEVAHLAERHAILRRVAGRWLIESQGTETLRVGDGRPTKVAWLNPGDVIHLSATGPAITFDPPVGASVSTDDSGPIRLAAPIPTVPKTSLPLENEPLIIPPELQVEFDLPDKPLPRTRLPAAQPEVQIVPVASNSQPFQWKPLVTGAVAVFVIVVAIKAMWQPPRNVVVTPAIPAAVPSGVAPARPEIPPERPSAPAVATAPTAQELSGGVYLVLLSAPDRDQTYRLGTAWAVGKRRLVTSAAVGQGIQQLQEQLPRIVVRSSGDGTAVEIARVIVHPEYRQIAESVAVAQGELDDIQSGLSDAEDSTVDAPARDAEVAKLAAAKEKLLELLQQQLDFDLAVLEVDRDLPTSLTETTDTAAIRPGASVKLIGMPFPVEEFLVDPEASLSTTTVAGQVQAKVAAEDQSVLRWLVKFREAKPTDNWSGSPVVNSRGEVVGVYSRPTPPAKLDGDYVPSTHEITTIDRLKEIR